MVSRREVVARVGLVVGALLVGLLALELGCRLAKGRHWLKHWPNTTVAALHEAAAEQERWTIHDPLLGWVPRPGVTPYGTFDQGGFRHTPVDGAAPPLVATGGSFTLGDDVTDGETWPAVLERVTGRDVVNAGVSSYGLDQVVLRSEQLARALRPAAVIVAFTADNIWRNEMSRLWGAEKPYFSLRDDGKLELHNVPVPAPPYSATLLQRLFGWSALIETVARRLGRRDSSTEWQGEWLNGNIRARPAGDGEHVACALMERLASLDMPVLVVAQYERWAWEPDAILAAEQRRLSLLMLRCAADAGLDTLDTFGVLDAVVRHDGLSKLYGPNHHNRSGNAIVARLVSEALRRHKLLRPASRTMTRQR